MKPRYTLTHRHLFFMGWVYYLVVPLTLAYTQSFALVDSLASLGPYYDVDSPYWPHLVSFSLAAPMAYWVGSLWRRLRASEFREAEVEGRRVGAWMLLPIYALLICVFAVQARSLLGVGYIGDLDFSLVGPLATAQMLILYQYLYERGAGHRITNAFAFLLVVNSMLLLSMGGRLYVMSTLVAIYFRWWNWGASSRRAQLRSLMMILFAPVVLVSVGMWRVGETDYSLVGFYLVAESMFTSISAFTLFAGGHWSGLFDVPYEFSAAFANIVPSQLWPGKSEWLTMVASAAQNFESPYGGMSIVASSVESFGFVGGLGFFMIVGLYMTAVGRTGGKAFREAYYCYLVGLLPFMFFRDPFQVQVKLVLLGFILYSLTSPQYRRRKIARLHADPVAAAAPR